VCSLVLFSVTGCAKLAHLDQLLALKAVSEEQQGIAEYARAKDERFEMMRAMVHSGDIRHYRGREEVLARFGEPVRRIRRDGPDGTAERWIYRRQTGYFSTPKIYLYFDRDGRLRRWAVTGETPEQPPQGT
jgi:hypothetical protein